MAKRSGLLGSGVEMSVPSVDMLVLHACGMRPLALLMIQVLLVNTTENVSIRHIRLLVVRHALSARFLSMVPAAC